MTSERLETRARVSWRSAMWAAVAGCLLLPLVAMQVTDEVTWTGFDFIAAAVLLIGAGLAFELVVRLPFSKRARAVAVLAIGAFVTLLWAHGAVGVF
jgi:hypothetical protein